MSFVYIPPFHSQAANSLKCAEGLLTLVIAKPGKSVHYEATTPTTDQSYQQHHWNKGSTESQTPQQPFLDVNSNPESKSTKHKVASSIPKSHNL